MNIRERIFGNKKKTLKEKDILQYHDIMMVEYGWIPLEQFKQLPIPTFFNLMRQIGDRKQKESDAMKKSSRKR